MKYYEFEKSGIHSRLKNIIKSSGGYNYRLAGDLLMKEYEIPNQEIAYEMAKNENIRDEIENNGLDKVIEIDYDMLDPIITKNKRYLIRFIINFYHISKIISYYIISNKLEIETKKIECVPDEIKPLEIKVLTDIDEIEMFIEDYKNK